VRSTAALLGLVVASSGCGLTSDFSVWTMELVAPLDEGGQLAFCPLANSVAGQPGNDRFLPDANVVVAFTVENDDIYTFSQPGVGFPGQAGVTSTMFELFGGSMVFDLGPLGTAYDDVGEIPLTIAGTPTTRTLLDGNRKGDDEIELRYQYVPSCTTFALTDGGECTCASTVMTWRFVGSQ
jgi:hypothetical protein